MAATAVVIGRKRGLRGFWASLDSGQRRTVLMMATVVGGLHLVGFGILYLLVVPERYQLGSAGAFTLGIGVTAYTLGMRHAFDADHIAAIDNMTRKLMSEGKRPLSVGFWFSLGHSSVVLGLSVLLACGLVNLAMLSGVARAVRALRSGGDEAEVERLLAPRGPISSFTRRFDD